MSPLKVHLVCCLIVTVLTSMGLGNTPVPLEGRMTAQELAACKKYGDKVAAINACSLQRQCENLHKNFMGANAPSEHSFIGALDTQREHLISKAQRIGGDSKVGGVVPVWTLIALELLATPFTWGSGPTCGANIVASFTTGPGAAIAVPGAISSCTIAGLSYGNLILIGHTIGWDRTSELVGFSECDYLRPGQGNPSRDLLRRCIQALSNRVNSTSHSSVQGAQLDIAAIMAKAATDDDGLQYRFLCASLEKTTKEFDHMAKSATCRVEPNGRPTMDIDGYRFVLKNYPPPRGERYVLDRHSGGVEVDREGGVFDPLAIGQMGIQTTGQSPDFQRYSTVLKLLWPRVQSEVSKCDRDARPPRALPGAAGST